MCLRAAAVFLLHFFSLKNEKYCAAVASVSWLTDAAYPLRVHTVFLRFPNFELSQKSRLGLLAKLCGVALILPRCLQHVFDENSIPNVRRVDQDVGDGADELAVLDDGAAGHE